MIHTRWFKEFKLFYVRHETDLIALTINLTIKRIVLNTLITFNALKLAGSKTSLSLRGSYTPILTVVIKTRSRE